MDSKSPQSLILLTYKGKVLLMYKSNSPVDKEKHEWCFIGGIKDKRESIESALYRWVKKEIGVQIETVEFVSDSCYHARLTDDNVNRIKRSEGQLLDFFTLKEVRKLFVSNATEQFISKHSDLM